MNGNYLIASGGDDESIVVFGVQASGKVQGELTRAANQLSSGVDGVTLRSAGAGALLLSVGADKRVVSTMVSMSSKYNVRLTDKAVTGLPHIARGVVTWKDEETGELRVAVA